MYAKLMDGKALATKLCTELAKEITTLQQQGLRRPGLAVILVGDTDPASAIYVRNKQQACETIGMHSVLHHLTNTTSQTELAQLIQQLNQDPTIDGILVQLPLPDSINTDAILEMIAPNKDVDGFHPYNLGRLAQRQPLFRPCTPYGIMLLLKSIHQSYKNQHAVVIGASNIVGRPMALELLMAGCTITLCHRDTLDLAHHIAQADILVSATGQPGLIQGQWIKQDATVIDVGLTRLADGNIVGDVQFSTACERARWITPVPGGVGPMTVASLLKNTLLAYKNNN